MLNREAVPRCVLAVSIGAACAQDEVSLSSAFGSGEGVNGEVLAIVIQPDGKIVIGGRFSSRSMGSRAATLPA